MDYLCIDTNIYVQCCVLEIEKGDNSDSLKELRKLLDEDKIKLLLPEVVELEFYNVLASKTQKIFDAVNQMRAEIGKNSKLDQRIKNDIDSKLKEFIEERREISKKVKTEIESIFSHKNTIKKGLELSSNDIVGAYKSFLSGNKPYKLNKMDEKEKDLNPNCLQPDCLIIESLKNYFVGIPEYNLYFCSYNYTDFAQNTPLEGEELQMHETIAKSFSNISLYSNLLRLLNENFDTSFPQTLVDKFEEKNNADDVQDVQTIAEISSASVKTTDDNTGEAAQLQS